MKDISNYSLLQHNTFGIDARCRRFVEYASTDEAQQVADMLTDDDRPLLIIGAGSNLLLTGDYPATVLHSAIKGHQCTQQGDDVLLRCGSGETFDDIVALCVERGWHGAENLSLIPGEVGASAVQNIGAYGAEAKDIIEEVEAVEISSGRTVSFCRQDCQYAYRDSRFKHEWKDRFLITYVTYRLSTLFSPALDYGNLRQVLTEKGIDEPTPQQLRDVVIEIRRKKLPDPAVEGNAGSFFMNPVVSRDTFLSLNKQYPDMPHFCVSDDEVKIPAAWMIEQCGWKGRSLGPAAVHSKQALVLVNKGGATGSDIVRLCDEIRKDVKGKFGIDLRPEVNIR